MQETHTDNISAKQHIWLGLGQRETIPFAILYLFKNIVFQKNDLGILYTEVHRHKLL